ncbi:leukocyte elastase inhibitor-like [Penaeus japonicus]|uniref:leukocyte elastase inhibitor-like n=1 Tax=Penaeus japonicus TaxID=27405 RepID=UPI001C70D3CC|nr:leukocyte elastase inhibitor-like [Penaeus japonicus]
MHSPLLPLVASAAALLSLPAAVSAQCLSRNDHKFLTKDPDLFPLAPFGLSLFRELVPPAGNFAVSPFSVWSALVAAYFGSGGNTESELRRALQLNGKENALALYKCVAEMYAPKATNPNYRFTSASRIYAQEGSPLRACVRGALGKELETVDFQQVGAAAAMINAFVSGVTRGKVHELVTSLDPGARAVLVNAAHFEGVWQEPFLLENTRRESFFAARGRRAEVDMMTQRALFKIGAGSSGAGNGL